MDLLPSTIVSLRRQPTFGIIDHSVFEQFIVWVARTWDLNLPRRPLRYCPFPYGSGDVSLLLQALLHNYTLVRLHVSPFHLHEIHVFVLKLLIFAYLFVHLVALVDPHAPVDDLVMIQLPELVPEPVQGPECDGQSHARPDKHGPEEDLVGVGLYTQNLDWKHGGLSQIPGHPHTWKLCLLSTCSTALIITRGHSQ